MAAYGEFTFVLPGPVSNLTYPLNSMKSITDLPCFIETAGILSSKLLFKTIF
jgi:hypothetical protein